ncbi:radical SAM protein [Mitsuaria sp. WAJ17]|uniref:radical SAM protein n=1 Tax=Mitsuaria sp. WAJ17 TaxID=2761452 RepID=UPI001600A5B3|nr:radical SAM protein [Mitsuaria sp. WAJ17]MBB2483704.1 radical SAM protein [Mitsuaria sp. WAJ17]
MGEVAPLLDFRRRKAPAWDVDSTDIHKLQVILKTIERCNINCSYCYYFNGGDDSYKSRPAVISKDVVEQVAAFLAHGVTDLRIQVIEAVFHGGEPLMQSRSRFDHMCSSLRSAFSGLDAELRLGIQTNGTLLDEAWCELLARHRVTVGISIDGSRLVNDRQRVDHKGRGTYDDVVKGIRCLQSYAARHGVSFGLGSLTVVDPRLDCGEIYRHLAGDLGFDNVSFLLPDCSHDSFDEAGATPAEFGQALTDIFDAWVQNPSAEVRNISTFLDFFRAGPKADQAQGAEGRNVSGRERSYLGNQIIVINSDGCLSIDDSLMPALRWWQRTPKQAISQVSLREWLGNAVFAELQAGERNLPDERQACAWRGGPCQGGDLENRFSSALGFDAPSVFCEGMSKYYEHVAAYLVSNGYPAQKIKEKLMRQSFLGAAWEIHQHGGLIDEEDF